jgi:hypothetical protein
VICCGIAEPDSCEVVRATLVNLIDPLEVMTRTISIDSAGFLKIDIVGSKCSHLLVVRA